jgi:hypothetical protein
MLCLLSINYCHALAFMLIYFYALIILPGSFITPPEVNKANIFPFYFVLLAFPDCQPFGWAIQIGYYSVHSSRL